MSKSTLLEDLGTALVSGEVSRRDVEAVLAERATDASAGRKLSVMQSLFYVAGLILFAAVLSVIGQTWGGGTGLHLFLTVVLGAAVWLIAYVLGKSSQASEVQRGLADALLLTGSLLMITGGYIVTNLIGAYGSVDLYEAAPALFALAGVHALIWVVVRRDLLFLMSILLGVAAVGSLALGFLQTAQAEGDIIAAVIVLLAALLAWTTRVLARLSPATAHLATSYDKFAIALGLLVMYIASFGEYAWVWYLLLAGAIIGVYYWSIASRQRILLGTASVFLVLVAITLSFRYFSAFGVTTSLLLSAAAILGVAMLAARINKRNLA